MKIEQLLTNAVGELPDGLSESVALGTGLADGYDLFASPLGDVAVSFNLLGVSSVDLADEGFQDRFRNRYGRDLLRAEPPKAWRDLIQPAIEVGRPGRLPVDLRSVTTFQAGVLNAAALIPKGEMRSYSWLASRVDRPRAARAVGSTMASNPVPLIIPCHRVVRSDGQIGEYSLGGPHNKWILLETEGADPARLVDLSAGGVRVQGNRSTGIFCHPTCRAIRRSRNDNVIGFNSSASAVADGYRPCLLCKPV